MRKLLLGVLITLSLNAAMGMSYIDGIIHFAGGYMGRDYLVEGLGVDEELANGILQIGFIGKEVYDYATDGGFDLLDIVAGMFGADLNKKVHAN